MRLSTRSSSTVLPLGSGAGGAGFGQPEQVAELRRLLPEQERGGFGKPLQAALQPRQKAAVEIPRPAQQQVGGSEEKEQGTLCAASFHGSDRLNLYIGKSAVGPDWPPDRQADLTARCDLH